MLVAAGTTPPLGGVSLRTTIPTTTWVAHSNRRATAIFPDAEKSPASHSMTFIFNDLAHGLSKQRADLLLNLVELLIGRARPRRTALVPYHAHNVSYIQALCQHFLENVHVGLEGSLHLDKVFVEKRVGVLDEGILDLGVAAGHARS